MILTAIFSLIPIILLCVLMMWFKIPGHISALITLVVTLILAIIGTPALDIYPAYPEGVSMSDIIFSAVGEAVLKAFFPILLIILTAIYSYNILVATDCISEIKRQFSSLTSHKGITVLLVTWGLGGLLEGMAGFGTSVAIPAALLIGLGYKPLFSAVVSLMANSVSTSFGAVGVSMMTLCNEASEGGNAPLSMIESVSSDVIMQIAPFFFLIPFAILTMTDRRHIWSNLCISVITGLTSIITYYVSSRWLGPETPTILGSIVSVAALIVYARCIRSKGQTKNSLHIPMKTILHSWSMYIVILLMILLSSPICPLFSYFFKNTLVSRIHFPYLGNTFTIAWIGNAAFFIFVGSIIGGLILKMTPRMLMKTLLKTVYSLRFTTMTILSLITMASIMNYCGMITTLACGLIAISGDLYPLFAPLVGAIGTFVTGSHTSSNILFGKLQAHAAANLGAGQVASDWLTAANTTGATAGKMVCPQSIAVASASCDLKDEDDDILRRALPYAMLYIVIAGIIVWLGYSFV